MPTDGGRSVGIVRSWTKAMEFRFFSVIILHYDRSVHFMHCDRSVLFLHYDRCVIFYIMTDVCYLCIDRLVLFVH
jgi:hypothetical protein